MYILKDNIWQWDYQPSQLKHIDFNNTIYLHTNDTISILSVKIYTNANILYNHEKVLHTKLVGGTFTLCKEINTNHHYMLATLCDMCGKVRQYCRYYQVNHTMFNMCPSCYQEAHGKLPTTVFNTRPSKIIGNHEQKIDVAYKYNHQVIFLCRNTFHIDKIRLINDVYFRQKPWYTIQRQLLCDFCYKHDKYHVEELSCNQCRNHIVHLWYDYIRIYLSITQLEIPNDIINTMIYYFILGLGYDEFLHLKIAQIRNPPIIIIPIIQLPEVNDNDVETEEDEEDYTYLLENYEEIYGLNDDPLNNDELGHWDEI